MLSSIGWLWGQVPPICARSLPMEKQCAAATSPCSVLQSVLTFKRHPPYSVPSIHVVSCNHYRVIVSSVQSSSTILSCDCNRDYYIDTSVLQESTPLVKFIRNYIRDSSCVFSISFLTSENINFTDIYGGPQEHSEFQTTLPILNLTPNSWTELRILKPHSELLYLTPNSWTSLRTLERHSEI